MKMPEAKKRIICPTIRVTFSAACWRTATRHTLREADVLPTDIDDVLRAGYARHVEQKRK